MNAIPVAADTLEGSSDDNDIYAAVRWLEQTLPCTVRRLMDTDDLDMPILQLPLAQLRLAQALYCEDPVRALAGESMGRLSEKLGVRQNALTQAADRLVNHKMAERLSDINDRRIVRLRLTDLGTQCVAERRSRRRARLDSVYRALPSHERADFLRAVRTLESAVQRLDAINSNTNSYMECSSDIGIEPQTGAMPAVNAIVFDQEEQ